MNWDKQNYKVFCAIILIELSIKLLLGLLTAGVINQDGCISYHGKIKYRKTFSLHIAMDLNTFINLGLLQICFAIMKCDIGGVISMCVSLGNKKLKSKAFSLDFQKRLYPKASVVLLLLLCPSSQSWLQLTTQTNPHSFLSNISEIACLTTFWGLRECGWPKVHS